MSLPNPSKVCQQKKWVFSWATGGAQSLNKQRFRWNLVRIQLCDGVEHIKFHFKIRFFNGGGVTVQSSCAPPIENLQDD